MKNVLVFLPMLFIISAVALDSNTGRHISDIRSFGSSTLLSLRWIGYGGTLRVFNNIFEHRWIFSFNKLESFDTNGLKHSSIKTSSRHSEMWYNIKLPIIFPFHLITWWIYQLRISPARMSDENNVGASRLSNFQLLHRSLIRLILPWEKKNNTCIITRI